MTDRIEAARAALGGLQARILPPAVRELLGGLLDELEHVRGLMGDAFDAAHRAGCDARAAVDEHEKAHHPAGRMDQEGAGNG